jgi:hypothetical protein
MSIFLRLFFCLLCGLPLLALAQTKEIYRVVKVRGNIQHKTLKRPIAVGDAITPQDQLQFSNPQAAAVIMSNKRGRFTLQALPAKAGTPAQNLWTFVKTVMLPVKSNGLLSTRGGTEPEGIVSDLQDYFGQENFFFIGTPAHIRVSQKVYPLQKNQYFVYRYEYRGKPVNKRIDASQDTLILDEDRLYSVEGKHLMLPDSVKAQIFYLKSQEEASLITTFTPVFISESQLKRDIKLVLDLLRPEKLAPKQLKDQLYQHVTDLYGKTDLHLFDAWLTRNFSL